MATHGNAWPYMAMSGHAWPCMAIYGHVWPCMAMHGHAWPYMAIHGHTWHQKSENRQQISKNPKIKISFRCVEFRENPENLSFTFFAFLPPYLNVSDSLAYSKVLVLKRSIDWYKKLFISCLVAGYSDVFVVKDFEFESLWDQFS